MIGTRVTVRWVDDKADPVDVEITHYAMGRLARWARINGLPDLSPESAATLGDKVLCLQVSCWAELTRGQAKPQDFDEWVASVADFDPADEVPLDPTQPAT